MIIYKVTNLVNGKQYVGKTNQSAELRWIKHVSAADHKSDSTLHKAIRKYGKEQFALETLYTCDSEEELNFAEIAFINVVKSEVPNCYNLSSGGEGGGVPSLETRERMRLSHLGKKDSTETRLKKSKASKGRKKTKRHSENISRGSLGKKFSKEHVENLRTSHLGKTQSEETKNKRSVSMKHTLQAKTQTVRLR